MGICKHRGAESITCLVFIVSALTANCAKSVDLIGYVPYYRMEAAYTNNILPAQLPMLDEVRYFGLTASSTGTITPLNGSGTLQAHLDRINTIQQKINALPIDQRPRLDITLGGAGEATSFATIAANASLQTTFSQNINSLLNQTGATAVDIDWEHPQGVTQFNSYGTLLQRIKQELGTSRRVYATIDPTVRVPLSVLDGPNAIDGISLMTYELAWWANDAADPNRGEHSLAQYVTDSVDAWTDAPGSTNRRPYVFAQWGRGADEADLGVGLPFFGRVIGTTQSPMGGTAHTYSEIATGATPTDASGNYYTYFGQPVWTAGPALAEQRVQFVHVRGLQHVIIWEIAQDLAPSNPNSLLRRAYEKNLSLTPVAGDYDTDRDVDGADYTVWKSNFGSTSDLRADGNKNGVVDSADFVFWRRQAGQTGSSAMGALIPEPAIGNTLLLLLFLQVCRRDAISQ
jgi:GH18 family chitinase